MMRAFPLRSSFAALALVIAGCAGPGAATLAPTSRPPTSAPATSPPAATTAPVSPGATGAPAGDATVQLASSDLGEILVDAEGLTLYGFTPDEATGEPTCYDDCAASWPPLVADESFTVGEGLDEAMFVIVSRTDDAGDQLKFGTYPLYYFAGDTAPGQTNGQGLGENWFVIGADGELIREE